MLTTIGFPLLFLGCLVLNTDMKRELFGYTFVLNELFVIIISIKNRDGNLIENKIVGIFMYLMRICTKYNLFRKYIMKKITNNILT